LWVRPEPTQLEDLSDASFLGKLLVLPANVRLDWKVIARYKHSSLFGLVVCNEGKKFYNIDSKKHSLILISNLIDILFILERVIFQAFSGVSPKVIFSAHTILLSQPQTVSNTLNMFSWSLLLSPHSISTCPLFLYKANN